MKTFLFTILLFFGTAIAEAPDGYASLVASDINAVVVECPDYLGVVELSDGVALGSCFRFDGSDNLLRLSLENFADNYSDVTWRNAWQESGALLFRGFVIGDEHYTFYVVELSTYEQLVALFRVN